MFPYQDSLPSTPRASLYDLVTASEVVASPPRLERRSSLSRLFQSDVPESSTGNAPLPVPVRTTASAPVSVPPPVGRRATRSQKYCFTVFAKEGEDILQTRAKFLDAFRLLSVKYLIMGVEIAPGTGRSHLQCFVIFNNARYFESVRTIDIFLEYNVHVEVANGSPTQNFDYCSKENNFVELGTRPVRNPHSKGIIYTFESLREFGVYIRRFPQIPRDQVDMYFDLLQDVNDYVDELINL